MKLSALFFTRTTFAGLLGALLMGNLAPLAAQEYISFPARSSDIATDSYWTVREFGEGCCVIDFNVRRWDGSFWEGETGLASNDQDYTWEVPLYAPANGEVISCWRNFPDDPQPGVNPPNNNIFAGGNHVVILTDEGNVISLNHLRAGTIPASLCPANPDSTQYPATTAIQGAWRIAAYIDPADRVRVQEGDPIGKAGNSGTSSGAHLHMSFQDVIGVDAWGRELLDTPEPMRFRNTWGHRYEEDTYVTSSGWYRMRGEEFSGDPACPTYQNDAPECGFKTIHPSPYLRRAEAAAGSIKGGDVLFLSANRIVTATIAQSNDHLELISWDLVGLDTLDRKSDIDDVAVKEVALSEPTPDYVLAALRLADDTLKMIAYRVNALGDFQQVAVATAGEISELKVATLGGGDPKTVTAVRTVGGDMKLIVWDVDVANNGTVTLARLGETSTGPASRLAVTKARAFTGVYTALRDSLGSLKVIPWQISSDGLSFTRGDDVTSGTAGTEIAVAALAQGVAVAMRDAGGNLQLKTWSASGIDITSLQSSASAGAVSEVGLLTTPLGASNLTTPVRDGSGNLQLIGWAADSNGSNLRRLGSSKAGASTQIAASSVYRSYVGLDPRDMITTLVRASNGDLKLITWDTNLVNP